MPTRRALLSLGSRAAAISILPPLAQRLWAQAQPAPHGTSHPDDMTVNTAPHQEHYPPPDFGPPPTAQPAETIALRGNNSLKQHARRKDLLAGAAVVVRVLQADPALQQLVSDQYAILVPEAELKWRALRPSPTTYDFTASDALFAFAAAHQMQVRGHTLLWHNSVPDWLAAAPSSFNVRQLLVDHIHTVMGRYRGRVHSWDVVNEAILPADKQPGGLRKSFWYDAIGPGYIDLAYRTAFEADPHAKLTYNDYGVEYDSDDNANRRRAILALIGGMIERKVPLHAVGIQSHIHAASPNTIGRGLADYIDAIRTLGLEVYLTELDVNEDDVPYDDVARRDQAVADTYRQFLHVALAGPAVKALLTWGVSDRRTWLNDGPTHHRKQPNRPQRSLPFDPEYKPAPAFLAIRESIDQHSTS
jgi:endo-1,4-beta-xylanase